MRIDMLSDPNSNHRLTPDEIHQWAAASRKRVRLGREAKAHRKKMADSLHAHYLLSGINLYPDPL